MAAGDKKFKLTSIQVFFQANVLMTYQIGIEDATGDVQYAKTDSYTISWADFLLLITGAEATALNSVKAKLRAQLKVLIPYLSNGIEV